MGVFALGGNDAFWKFYRSAFRGIGELSPESFERWAQDAGVKDMGAWRAGAGSHAWPPPPWIRIWRRPVAFSGWTERRRSS